MQIDFHHAVTYITGRLAGFSHDDAATVAHAAQYVDDATDDGAVQFDTGARYVRVTSAHKTLDVRLNSNAADNRLVWVPFHFLPGNEAPAGDADAKTAFLSRMVCRPGSPVAYAMLEDVIREQDAPWALHRLGIALHTFVDTWAHQHFVGIVDDFNKIESIEIEPLDPYGATPLYGDLTSGVMRFKEYLADHLPVGHAGVLTFPDMPFLKWRFTRKNGEFVERDNRADFLLAAEAMYNVQRRFIARDATVPATSLPAADRSAIDDLLRNTLSIDGASRHQAWLAAIAAGRFSFGPASVQYVELGEGSWKFQALGKDPDDEADDEVFTFDEKFLTSDWKRFHDAVQYHRLFILHRLLPRFGLSAS